MGVDDLAINGGPRAIEVPFAPYRTVGREEARAAARVVESGVLSGFLGSGEPAFYGGPKVQELERNWERHFGVEHAISVNSNTSGLIAAVGAVGIEPGDEIIVSPWTMCASATAILIWNAIPVFADIEEETFNLSPEAVRNAISSRTKAIVVPNIFGHPAELEAITAIAREYALHVIEDNAQSPGALYRGRQAGSVGDIGVYSLNCHKHINTGEGGVCVTNDARLARRLQLIRNHAEAVVTGMDVGELDNMIGFNFRMTEVEAAIGIEQLRKLDDILENRRSIAARFTESFSCLEFLRPPVIKPRCSHVYYVYPLVLQSEECPKTRDEIVSALEAEGVPGLMRGYANVHLLPIYQKRIAYGKKGYPWRSGSVSGNVSYERGICPVAERLHDLEFIGIEICQYRFDDDEIDRFVAAFEKVWNYLVT